MYADPVRPRPRPPACRSTVDWDGAAGRRFLVQDVYRGLDGVAARLDVKRLRIVGVPPKVQPQMNQPSLGVSREDPGKFVLGTVPVEADGSAYFRVPSGMPVFFQALDEQGLAVQTMRSLTYVQPADAGLHRLPRAPRHDARAAAAPAGRRARASLAIDGPARTAPGRCASTSWSNRCWIATASAATARRRTTPQAAAFDLTAAASLSTTCWTSPTGSAATGLRAGSVAGRRHARPAEQVIRDAHVDGNGHDGVRFLPKTTPRLVTWMDTYAQHSGSFSEQQEHELQALRKRFAGLFQTP